MQDIVNSGDTKKVMQSILPSFLSSLDYVVTKILKDKKYEKQLDFFKTPIIEELKKNGEKILEVLKEIILVRGKDRVVRENTIKAVKRLLKIASKVVTRACYNLKIHVFTTFILEREFKSSAVAKERQ
jgi:hypothetical protein